ncbi:MAG TPA: hypothetical protein VHZ28_12500 [Terracidiphilus sp.]|jgi:hypothetical protein|nr:hypothetical protein [Terracidiphilus sp.]
MPRKVVRKERGVVEKEARSDIWWIRFKDARVEHREKVRSLSPQYYLNQH